MRDREREKKREVERDWINRREIEKRKFEQLRRREIG